MRQRIDAGLEDNGNRVNDESMDVGDSSGVDDTKRLVVEALQGRESLMQKVVYCLVSGGINLELQHAFAHRNSVQNVGKEYLEA